MTLIPLYIAIPLISAFLIPILGKIYKPLVWMFSILVSFILFVLALYGIALTQNTQLIVYQMGNWAPPLGIVMAFDSFSAFMVLVIAVVVFASCLFSLRFLSNYTGQWKFYTLFMLLTAGVLGIVITGDLFNMFVFLEIAAIASYALVAFGIDGEQLEASFKYMVMGEIGGLTFLLAIALLYAKVSTLNLADISISLQAVQGSTFFWLVLGLMVFAFSIKAALVPFHSWCPDAYPSALAPIASLLAGVCTKVFGIYTLARLVFNVFALSRAEHPWFFNVLIGAGLLSIIFAGITALNQKDFKRLLAFSSISQVGFIVLGFGLGNYYGVLGAVFFILAHGLSKALLFFTSGSVEHTKGTTTISDLGGVGERMPTTAWSFRVGAMSVIGLPPFVGFWAKLFIIIGAVKAGMLWLAIVTGVLSVLSLAYLLKIENNVFMKKTAALIKDAPFTMRIAMVFMVILIVITGIGFQPVVDVMIGPAAHALLRGIEYAHLVFEGVITGF